MYSSCKQLVIMVALGIGSGASIANCALAFFICHAVSVPAGNVLSWRTGQSGKTVHTDFIAKSIRYGIVWDALENL